MSSINELSQNSNAVSDIEVSVSGAPSVQGDASFAQRAVAWVKSNKRKTAGIVSVLLLTAIVAGAIAGSSRKSSAQSASALVCVAEDGQFSISGVPAGAQCAVRDDTLERYAVVDGGLVFEETSSGVTVDFYENCQSVAPQPLASVVCSGDADYEYSA